VKKYKTTHGDTERSPSAKRLGLDGGGGQIHRLAQNVADIMLCRGGNEVETKYDKVKNERWDILMKASNIDEGGDLGAAQGEEVEIRSTGVRSSKVEARGG